MPLRLTKSELGAQKAKLFCDTSFKIQVESSKTKLFCETCLKNDSGPQSSHPELPWLLLMRMLQEHAPATKKFSRGKRTPLTTTRHDPCKAAPAEYKMCNLPTKAWNINLTEQEIHAPAMRKASLRTLFKSTTPANMCATLTNPCGCHACCNVAKSLRLNLKESLASSAADHWHPLVLRT